MFALCGSAINKDIYHGKYVIVTEFEPTVRATYMWFMGYPKFGAVSKNWCHAGVYPGLIQKGLHSPLFMVGYGFFHMRKTA